MSTILPSTLWTPQAVKVRLDTLLADFYEQRVLESERVHDSYHALWLAMQQLSSAGGKRVRPYLTVLAYQACGGENVASILPVALAQEFLHASLLMHDDIIDRDYTRYGTENIAGQFRARYRTLVTDEARADHYADGAALLAGDLLLSSAHATIAASSLSALDIARSQQLLHEAVLSVAAGELLDSEASLMPPDEIDALQIAELKTAGYSFSVPLRSGAMLAGASDQKLAALAEFGRTLGIAYQLIDDILGVFGESKVTGKSDSSDITEGKRTYLLQATLERVNASDRDQIISTVGDTDASDTSIAHVREIMQSSGALDETKVQAQHYADQARAALQPLAFSPEASQAFDQLITMTMKRVK